MGCAVFGISRVIKITQTLWYIWTGTNASASFCWWIVWFSSELTWIQNWLCNWCIQDVFNPTRAKHVVKLFATPVLQFPQTFNTGRTRTFTKSEALKAGLWQNQKILRETPPGKSPAHLYRSVVPKLRTSQSTEGNYALTYGLWHEGSCWWAFWCEQTAWKKGTT